MQQMQLRSTNGRNAHLRATLRKEADPLPRLVEALLYLHEKGHFNIEIVKKVKRNLKGVNFTVEDIQRLIHEIGNRHRDLCENTGRFISHLVNEIIRNEDVFTLEFPYKRLNYLGEDLKKGQLILKGKLGSYLANGQMGGRIVVYGYVLHYAGRGLRGGELILRRNAGSYLANGQKGGIIVAEGSVGLYAGYYMLGGELVIKGSAGSGLAAYQRGGSISAGEAVEYLAGWRRRGGELIIRGKSLPLNK